MNELYIEHCSGLVRKTAELGNVFCKDCKVEGFVDEAEFRKGDLLFQKSLSLHQKKHDVKGMTVIMFELIFESFH